MPARLEPVLLYSIYCIAACVVPGEQAPASEAEEDAQDDVNLQDLPGAAHSRGSDPAMAEDYYRRAERYLYEGRLRPNVSTIQALFLLSLYSHGSGELSRAWVYSGLATSMAIDLGLHRWPIHRLDLLHESVERETRIRLVWHCYILDKVLAAEMGRPVGMRAKDCDAPLLSETEKDEFELWSDQTDMQTAGFVKDEASPSRYLHAPSCLNWGVRLFMIVERILSEVHSFRRKAALRKQGGSDKILAELDAELRNWKKSLPEHLWLKLETKDGGPLPSFFALHVWHFTATLLLHRPFIPQDEGVPLADVLANDSHKKCTEAANSICDLLEFSSTCIKVDRLSTDLAYCLFTAAVMFVFNARLSDPVISSDARRRFSLCREWLKKLSKTWPTASAHKQLLDGFSMVGDDVARVTEESSAAEGALAIRPALPDSTQASDAQTAEQNLQFSFHGAQASESSKLWEPSNERTEQLSDGPAAHRQSPLQPNTPTILQDGLVPKISTTQSTPQSSPTHLHSAQMPPRASSVHPPEVSSSLARPHNLQPTNSAIAPHARAAAKFAPYSSDRGNFRNENFGVVNQQQQQQQADQRAQFLQYYNSSSGPKPTAPHMGSTSQLTSAPGIFDLEGVFWNETAAVNTPYGMPGPQRAQVSSLPMPGGSHVPQQQQQQQQQSQALSRPEQHQAQHEYLQGQRNTHGYAPAADGLAMLAHVTGAGGSLPMSRPQDAAAAQAQAQTHQNPGQEQTPQGHYGHNAGQEWRGPAPHNQAQAGQMPQQLQGPGHQQQTISQLQAPPQAAYAGRPGQTGTASGNAQAGLSPFGFSLDPGQPAWSDIMSMLELPPAFT